MNIPEQNKDTPTPDPIPPSDSSEPFPSVAQDPRSFLTGNLEPTRPVYKCQRNPAQNWLPQA